MCRVMCMWVGYQESSHWSVNENEMNNISFSIYKPDSFVYCNYVTDTEYTECLFFRPCFFFVCVVHTIFQQQKRCDPIVCKDQFQRMGKAQNAV
jgi:hypothetical protein